MNCRVCNTRVRSGGTNCPNCGNPVGPGASNADESQPSLRPGSLPTPKARVAELPPEEEPEDEKPLERAEPPLDELPLDEPVQKPGRGVDVKPDLAELREMLARRPEALDRGLTIYKDKKGKPVGAGYASGVGEIDLLAEDASGALVAVMVAEHTRAEELVSEVLQRMGWVRKHLADGKTPVRGIVLIDEPPESLSYAAAAVADTVAFMTYRIALTFEPIEL